MRERRNGVLERTTRHPTPLSKGPVTFQGLTATSAAILPWNGLPRGFS